MKPLFAVVLALLLAGAASGYAQTPPFPADTTDTLPGTHAAAIDTAGSRVDTVSSTLPMQPFDTVRYQRTSELNRFLPSTDTVDLEEHLSQNPTTALFKSMFIPGWGQLGNGSYIKALLFLGVDAWLVSTAISRGVKASDYFDSYEAATTVAERNYWYDRYDDLRSQRNKYTWFAVIVSFVSMFDAYVDAHFSGFPDAGRNQAARDGADKSKLSLDIGPDPDGGITASLSLGL